MSQGTVMLQDPRLVGVPERAAIYCRISSDRQGAGLGVQRQEQECRELAQELGWTVVDVYADNDVSAFDRKKPRPQWRRLLDDMRAGRIDAVLAWHVDRMYRRPRDLDELIDVIRELGTPVRTVVSGVLDLSNPAGVAMAKVAAVFAEYESAQKGVRQRSKARQVAEAGGDNGGGYRPFGYEDDRRTIRESEATLIREAARAVLTLGQPLGTICRGWNERGIRTVMGAPWTRHVLRRLLMSGRISGRREHKGVIITQAVWPGIISPADSDRLRELLSDPARTANHGDVARKYLLTGFLYCGAPSVSENGIRIPDLEDGKFERSNNLCGRKLIARPQGDRQRSYVCADVGMAHLRIHAESLELYVREAALDYLDEFVDLQAAVRTGSEATQEAEVWESLANYQRRLEEAERAFWVDGKLSEAAYRRVASALEAEIESRRAELTRIQRDQDLANLPATSALARTLWEEPATTFTWRRTLLRALVDRVTIGAGVRGRNKFDPERISITFRKPVGSH